MSDQLLRPRMALRVGVTGHRNLNAEVLQSVRPRLRAVLETVQQAAESARRASGAAYSDDPVLLRATSPLAEGTDRLLAAEALSIGYELQCPLPFLRGEYIQDFAGEASVQEFDDLLARAIAVVELDGCRAPESAPYETVGRLVLDHCDILIAVWDGQQARGKGGTANIVAMARRRGIPVFWLPTNTNERFLVSADSDEDHVELTQDGIAKVVHRLVSPPWLSSDDPASVEATGAYLASLKAGTTLLGLVWRAFEWVMSRGIKLPPYSSWAEDKTLADPFKPHYRRVNGSAKRMAGLYRGAFLVNYTLGVCAVFLALLNSVFGSNGWLIAELVAIAGVFSLVTWVRRNRWHSRTIDCRYLAEQFRILRYIFPLGLAAPHPLMPAHNQHADVRASWMDWRLRAILRQTPVPSVRVTPDYLQRCYRLVREEWVVDQIDYHRRNHLKLDTIDKRLHWLLWAAASSAAAACILHLFIHGGWLPRWLTLFAAGLPAAAGGFHAISAQGEFRRLSERSEAMCKSLEVLDKELTKLQAPDRLAARDLRRLAGQVAHVMLAEVVDWQVLYRKRPPDPL